MSDLTPTLSSDRRAVRPFALRSMFVLAGLTSAAAACPPTLSTTDLGPGGTGAIGGGKVALTQRLGGAGGIVMFDVRVWSDATGHFDVWNGGVERRAVGASDTGLVLIEDRPSVSDSIWNFHVWNESVIGGPGAPVMSTGGPSIAAGIAANGSRLFVSTASGAVVGEIDPASGTVISITPATGPNGETDCRVLAISGDGSRSAGWYKPAGSTRTRPCLFLHGVGARELPLAQGMTAGAAYGFHADGRHVFGSNSVVVPDPAEYIENENGAVWKADSSQTPEPWSVALLPLLPGTDHSIAVGSVALGTAQQVLVGMTWRGRWDGNYKDGKEPGFWTASSVIVSSDAPATGEGWTPMVPAVAQGGPPIMSITYPSNRPELVLGNDGQIATTLRAADGSTRAARLRVLPFICPADFNCSGSISVQDIFDFLAAYFGSDPRADFNASGAISVQDIFDFLAAYFAGCS